jgi:hypothetical protein
MMFSVEELLQTASKIDKFLKRESWKFCFIGGIAIQRWGELRFTRDVDLTLLTGFGKEEEFVDILLKEFRPRQPDAREFALTSRVLLAKTADGIDVDIALGALPFEERTIVRASLWEIAPNLTLTTCSAEDLVVHKVFAGRDLDWGDVERILIRQHGKLNLNQIRSELKPLLELKGEMDALNKFEQKLTIVDRRLRAKP